MSHIIAVRHGMARESRTGSIDQPLSDRGQEQMFRVANEIKSIADSFYVVCSDRLRSRMSAEILIKKLNISDYTIEPRMSQLGISQNQVEEIASRHRRNRLNTLFIAPSEFVNLYGQFIFRLFAQTFESDVDYGNGFHADMGAERVYYFPH